MRALSIAALALLLFLAGLNHVITHLSIGACKKIEAAEQHKPEEQRRIVSPYSCDMLLK